MPNPTVHLVAGPVCAAHAPQSGAFLARVPTAVPTAGLRQVMQDGRLIKLSRLQHQLLMLLLAKRGCVVTHADIERALYGRLARNARRAGGASNTIAVFVSQLRRKLGPNLIVTIHRVGYSMPNFD